MNTFSKLAFTALCVGLMQGGSAQAGETAQQGKQVVVSYGDLNIAHEAGARILINRLEQAAEKVCGGPTDIRDLESRFIHQACTKEAMDRAVASVNSQLVATLSGRTLENKVALSH